MGREAGAITNQFLFGWLCAVGQGDYHRLLALLKVVDDLPVATSDATKSLGNRCGEGLTIFVSLPHQ